MHSDNDEEVVSNNSIVKTIHLHAAEEDKTSNKQMSLKEATLVGVNGKRRPLKLTRPRLIGSTPPMTPRRSVGSTPPMTPRRSISSDLNDKSLTLGFITMSSAEGLKAGLRGKALRIAHYYRAFLWYLHAMLF
ncbi:unnamed protein product [Brassica oleracea]|uniref:Uncharacterized protein n=1 Tax=Brassica oleracea TaxID=3712 RepID=A0A3P6EFB0_BRAOL|nr:unnamed protein product [Brassica oleracea]